MPPEPERKSPLKSIPQPAVIRGRLAELYDEARQLRKLLRIADRDGSPVRYQKAKGGRRGTR
jgi:hypothetical protein